MLMLLLFTKLKQCLLFHRKLVTSLEVVPRLLHEGLFFGSGYSDLLFFSTALFLSQTMLLFLLLSHEPLTLDVALFHLDAPCFDLLLILGIHLGSLLKECFVVGGPFLFFATKTFQALALFACGLLSGSLVLCCGFISFLLDHLSLSFCDLTAFLFLSCGALCGLLCTSELSFSALLVLERICFLLFFVFLIDSLAVELLF